MDEQLSDLLRRISKYIFIAVAALLVLLLLLALLRVSIGFWLWSTVETWATVRLGLDSDATQLVTTILVSLITLLLPTLTWYFLWGKKQLWATGAVVGGQILIFLLVSTIGSGVCFDRNTGEPLCWYADIPSKGRVFSRTKGFDPVTGEEYKQYTREIAIASVANPKPIATPISANTSTTKNIDAKLWEGSVNPKLRWQSTGMRVGRGDTIQISASGSVTWAKNTPSDDTVGPNGTHFLASALTDSSGFPMLEAKCGSLIMRIGSSTYAVGESASIYSQQNGTIEFMINDRVNWLSDNSGSFYVTVRK